jgi:hypothetical protein
LQGRKPAAAASAHVTWNRTFSGRAGREGQDGRQYTPVVLTEYTKVPSADASRATTAAHRGSLVVPATSCACLADRLMCPPLSGVISQGTV